MKQTATVELAGGKTLHLETGHLAKQAQGSVIARMGDNVVLGTACCAPEPRVGIDFFPLTVDYREYTYAGGRIPGGFIKREGRPSEREVLTCRQIDRPIRPLFPEGFRNETQVISLVLSADSENDPDVLAINSASAALTLSDIPFAGPVGAVRVGLIAEKFVVNPTYEEMRESLLNIMVVGTAEGIVMVESGAKEVSEDQVLGAIEFAHEQIKKICAAISDLTKRGGKAKRTVAPVEFNQAYYDQLKARIGDELTDSLDTAKHPKLTSYEKVKDIKDRLKAELPKDDDEAAHKLSHYYEALRERIFRDQVTHKRRRPDARQFDQIRDIWIEVGVLPRVHGSAIFTRGETQALVTTTLGTPDDAQRVERFEGETKKRFMLHYNFPPFSVGEVGRMTGVGRREIGHGALAERAISAVLPDVDKWPYTMRVVSDILESNGSSSMASVCGASLSLMDAGVPLSSAVAGVAMGLVKEPDSYAILTDIAGAEDHYGDMDFKVAGTRKGITALQMDIKVMGITSKIMHEALEQARRGRLFILDKMEATLTSGRENISSFAPRIYTLQIPTDKIRDLIGPGGKMIRSIIDQTGVKIDVDDTGKVNVASSDGPSAQKAIQMINDLTAVPEVGKTYLGKVVRLAEFGAFVEIFPGTDGLLHISEIAEHRVKEVKDELKEGDQVLVKVLAMEGNRIKLSRKAILKEQRAKMAGSGEAGGGTDGSGGGGVPSPFAQTGGAGGEETITIEGGGDFTDDDEGGEPNFNREDANRETVGTGAGSGGGHDRPRGPRPPGSGGGGGGRRHGGRGGRGRGGPRGGGGGGDRGPRGGGGGGGH
ncbi:MAG TPA: polyribonucleotide nucleotidyltransferase [Verrucomicrobiae bacterium]|jgi:polyribonucleotide nucleotidyltransferase|nr:polyribonucleotide nucleotidyltransferase [Verrucomicrobiae bacterium]